jgi:alkanesulfonate monooxygenase SsuD/methylene tetrahydromethanopterin reductase-like flavin-dependent oxidoreductase (luciferase family)
MQVCLMVEGQQGVTWEQWVALARACEEHGIATMFRSDHYMDLSGRHPELGSLDAWGTLCALSAVTRTLRLGTMVSPATFRHPAELAKLVTTADHVSGGRVELGLGTGWHEPEHAGYGFPFADMKTRMDVLEEQLAVVHGVWGSAGATPGSGFSFHGEHYTLQDLRAEPGPVQSPHPPLIMGGAAGPRAARLAATWADEYNTTFPTVEDVRERRARIAAACERAGREPIPFSVMTTVLVGADDADLRERAQRLEQVAGLEAGSLLREAPEGWIVGTVERVAEQVHALGEAGAARIMCQHLLPDDLDVVALLGEGVAPLVA